MRKQRGVLLRARPKERVRGGCSWQGGRRMSSDLKERLTERLKTSRYWVAAEELTKGMRLDMHGEIEAVIVDDERVLVVTDRQGALPYRRGEKALLALPTPSGS